MNERTTLILAFTAVVVGAAFVFFALALIGASNDLLAFAYVLLLCGVSTAVSQIALRYWSKHDR